MQNKDFFKPNNTKLLLISLYIPTFILLLFSLYIFNKEIFVPNPIFYSKHLQNIFFNIKKGSEAYEGFILKSTLIEENIKLKNILDKYIKEASTTKALERENTELKQMLNLPRKDYTYVTSYILHDPFRSTKKIYISTHKSFVIGSPVISRGYVIGQIGKIYKNYTEVLPIDDKYVRVPVISSQSLKKAITYGVGDNLFRLNHSDITTPPHIKEGELLITSNSSSKYPSNLIVGKVIKVDKNDIIGQGCRPLSKIDFVEVIIHN